MQNLIRNAGRMHPRTASITIMLLAASVGMAYASAQSILYRADRQRTARSGYVATSTPGRTWTYRTGSLGSSSPVMDEDGVIYFAAYDNNLYAVKAQGELKWKHNICAKAYASAAIDNGCVYFGSSTGGLHALDNSGNSLWSKVFNAGKASVNGSALVDKNGCVYVGAQDNWIYAINPDGSLKWSFKTNGSVSHSLTTSPDESVIYAPSSDGCLYAINSDGTLRWKTNGIAPSGNCSVAQDGMIYVGSDSGAFYALDPDGNIMWSYQTMGKITTDPAVALDGTIYFGDYDSYLYALNPNGSLKWASRSYSSIYSSPTIDLSGTILYGSWNGYVTALDPVNGLVKWSKSIGKRIYSSPTIGSDGCVYVIDEAGNLVGVGATTTPEPSTMLALAAGVGALFWRRKKA
ncbi:MAG: PQQ-binding-like beta-propeller repeat protein [Armatimonadetes bacterium]|nr:PQQ-binding-like beta-propeller repeat protein [Armatimonadota bacterium]